jgi:hypothetical protein
MEIYASITFIPFQGRSKDDPRKKVNNQQEWLGK